MSKNTLGSGWVDGSDYPITNERILDWILGKPHNQNLKMFWRVIKEKLYLPQEGKHYKNLNAGGKFGDIEFIAINLGMQMDQSWNPEIDILIN
jgi:hypothetical protein